MCLNLTKKDAVKKTASSDTLIYKKEIPCV